LRGARQLLSDITSLGIPAGTEFLDTTFGQYYTDFISWGAIGARTVESQIHRQLASGLSMPVGIKNATNGDVTVAIDALVAAAASHLFPSLTKEGAPALLETTGNPDCHLILRGGANPNYDACENALGQLADRGIRTGVMVDCSHGNSQKQYARQLDVARAVNRTRAAVPNICGLMLESHLHAGRQDAPTTYGQSITDACLGWDATSALLLELFG
jgi:3-deoxy-7-phosphoheptulonate synthase